MQLLWRNNKLIQLWYNLPAHLNPQSPSFRLDTLPPRHWADISILLLGQALFKSITLSPCCQTHDKVTVLYTTETQKISTQNINTNFLESHQNCILWIIMEIINSLIFPCACFYTRKNPKVLGPTLLEKVCSHCVFVKQIWVRFTRI